MVMFRAIVPKKRAGPPPFTKPVERALRLTSKAIERHFQSFTRTWKRRPTFRNVGFKRPTEQGRVVFASNEILFYVTRGTRPHIIRARRAPMLVFQTGHIAATAPRKLISRSARKFGPIRKTKEVKHPGTEARDEDKEIVKREQARFTKNMQQAMTDGAKTWRVQWGGR